MHDRPLWALSRDNPNNHEREAARFRALASTATTAAVKARLLQETKKHEQIARGEPVPVATAE